MTTTTALPSLSRRLWYALILIVCQVVILLSAGVPAVEMTVSVIVVGVLALAFITGIWPRRWLPNAALALLVSAAFLSLLVCVRTESLPHLTESPGWANTLVNGLVLLATSAINLAAYSVMIRQSPSRYRTSTVADAEKNELRNSHKS